MTTLRKRLRSGFSLIGALVLLTGCREELLHDLNELQANRVIVVLKENGIDAVKDRNASTWTVSVPREQTIDALQALEKRRTTRRELRRFTEESKGLLQSREERLRFLERQKAWNLETTLESVPGVLEAHAQLFVPETDEFAAANAKQQMTASVLIIAEDGGAINPERLKPLIAGATGIGGERIALIIFEEKQAQDVLRSQPPTTTEQERTLPNLPAAVVSVLAALSFLVVLTRTFSGRPVVQVWRQPEVKDDAPCSVPQEQEGF